MPASRAATADRDRRVLEAMTPRVTCEASQIAAALGINVSAARHVLERLARDGRVARVEPVQRGMTVGWMRRG